MITLFTLLLTSAALIYLGLLLTDWIMARRAWQNADRYRLDFEPTGSDRLLIAHASGGSALGSYPNARQCLDQWYEWGIRHFEVDLQPTPDGEWIALHDWGPTLRRWFDLRALPTRRKLLRALRPGSALPSAEVRALPMRGNLEVLDPPRLSDWLAAHPDAWLVTDIKAGNPEGLKMLANHLGRNVSRVIAQVFTVEEIELAHRLGYGRVAWANYVPKWPLDTLADRLARLRLDLIVLDQRKLNSSKDHVHLEELRAQGREIWVFTVNDTQRLAELPAAIGGVITDRLVPAGTGVNHRHPC